MVVPKEEKKSVEKKRAPARLKEKIAKLAIRKPAAKPEEKKVEDPFGILRYVLMTEKAIQVIEMQNKLTFIVDRRATKSNIKSSVESAFQSKVVHVTTLNDQRNRKRAVVRFAVAGAAGDIAVRLGII